MEEYDVAQYDYVLPPERIAQQPAEPRDASRLMALDRASGRIENAVFHEVGRFLRPGDLLVLNNTRVFPARTYGTRSTGGGVELFFLRNLGEGRWEAMLRANGKPKNGEYVELEGGQLTVMLARQIAGGMWEVIVPRQVNLIEMLQRIGRTPLPPYIKRSKDRALEPRDRERYQTVFARETGAVAAPTAGLHFTPELLQALEKQGVGSTQVTLHVGAGTFQPVKEQDLREHRIHEEFYSISAEAVERIAAARKAGGRVVAVGTTACRTLETAARHEGGFAPGSGWTGLYIHPPFEFRLTDAMLTNFHLPRSTLLMLVAAFAGRERILAAYAQAVSSGYRFYSYGDAMFIG